MQEKKSHAYSEHSWALNLVVIPKKQYNTYLHCTIVSSLEMIEHVLEGAHRLYACALLGPVPRVIIPGILTVYS